MKSSPTFFIVPGFKGKTTDKSLTWLVTDIKKKSFKVWVVPIKWDYRVMSDYIDDFRKFYLRYKSKVNYVLGFSYGAVIAFSSASELLPDKIFLCSLSPDFNEDQSAMKPWLKKLVGKKRLQDSSSRSGKNIAEKLTIPTVVFYGEKEGRQYPELKKRSGETVDLAKNSKLIVVPGSPHKIDNPEYVKAIRKQLDLI